jgi:hypothetical protein
MRLFRYNGPEGAIFAAARAFSSQMETSDGLRKGGKLVKRESVSIQSEANRL